VNIADLLLVSIVAVSGYLGVARGIRAQLSVGFGIAIGLVLAAICYDKFALLMQASRAQSIILLLLTAAIILFCYSVTSAASVWLQHHSHAMSNRSMIGKITGLMAGIVFASLNLWIFISMFGQAMPTIVRSQLTNSVVVSSVRNLVPTPPIFTTVAHLLNPFMPPTAFAGNEPNFTVMQPTNSTEDLPTVVAEAKKSMVKVNAWGCGGASEGSGFWFGPHVILTNAHVVAGAHRFSVQNDSGVFAVQLIGFDPKTDYAVLLADTAVASTPLKLTVKKASAGTAVATLGYPGGGDLSTNLGTILQPLNAEGYDIYNTDKVDRSIYALHATIVPGDSGGPLITAGGDVIGLVFGNSTKQNEVGYAVATGQFLDGVHAAVNQRQIVDSGSCAAD